MKKFSLFLLLGVMCLFYLACSTESNEVTANPDSNSAAFKPKSLTTNDFETAKALYLAMIASQDYIDYKQSLKDFNAKLNANVTFSRKSDWMDWININISTTSFTDTAEFETMYDNSINLLSNIARENTALCDYIIGASGNQLIQIITPGKYEGLPGECPISVNQECFDNCAAIYEAAYDYQYYTCYMIEWWEALRAGGYEGIQMLRESDRILFNLGVQLAIEFNQCVGNCG